MSNYGILKYVNPQNDDEFRDRDKVCQSGRDCGEVFVQYVCGHQAPKRVRFCCSADHWCCSGGLGFSVVPQRRQKRLKVIFACVHNAGRSQMAAAFFNYAKRQGDVAVSAGTKPGERVHPEV